MQIIDKKSLLNVLKVSLALASLQCIQMQAYAEKGADTPNDVYVEHVVGVMRSHVLSMRMILDNSGLKYADNMVRHAEALERSFGMVGPMEWHVAEAFSHAQKTEAGGDLSKKEFEELAEETRLALKKIKRSAIRYGRDKKKKLVRDSINRMIASCGACHSKLPERTVPRVWKGMKE